MKSKLKIIAYLCALTLIIIVIFIFTNQKNQISFEPSPTESILTSNDNSKTEISQQASADASSPAPLQPPNQPSSYDSATDPFDTNQKSAIDREQFKEITAKNTKEIYKKMRVDEIKSLKESVINDKKLLKKIEDSGTGIEDYKFIQQNLKKRLDRLKVLESKK